MKWLVLFLTLLLSPGCFLQRNYVDRRFPPESVARIVPGTTTAAEVVTLLGAPNDVVQLGRRSAYLYRHDQQKNAGLLLLVVVLNNSDTQSDRAWVFFDENDVVTHVGATHRADDAEYAMPWAAHD